MAIYYLFEWSDDSPIPNEMSEAHIVGRFDDENTRPERALELWHIDKSNEIDENPDTKYVADSETESWSPNNDMLTLDYSLICDPPQIWHCKVATSKMQADQPQTAPNNTLENPLTTGLPVSWGVPAFSPVPGNANTPSVANNNANNNINAPAPNATPAPGKISYTASNGTEFEVEDYSSDKTYAAVKTALEINLDKEDALAIINAIYIDDGVACAITSLDSDKAERLMASFDIDSNSNLFSHEDYPDALIENISYAKANASKPYEAYSLMADLIMQQYDFKSLDMIADIFNIDDVIMKQIYKWQEKQPDYAEKVIKAYFRHENSSGFNGQLQDNLENNSAYLPSQRLIDILDLYSDECEAWYGISKPDAFLKPDCTKDDCIYAMNELHFPDRIRTAILNERVKLGYDLPSNASTVGFTDDENQEEEEADESASDDTDTTQDTDVNASNAVSINAPRDAYDVIESVYGKKLTDDDKEMIDEQFSNFTEDDLNSFITGLGITDESDKKILQDYFESFFDNNDDDKNDVNIADDEADALSLQMVAMLLGFNLDDNGINDARNAIITMSDDEFNSVMASLILTDAQEAFIVNLRKNGTVSPVPDKHDESTVDNTTSPAKANTVASTATPVADASKYAAIHFPMGMIKGRLSITGNAKPMLIRKLQRLMQDDIISVNGRNIEISNSGSFGMQILGMSTPVNASQLITSVKNLIDNANEVGLQISGELITPVDEKTIRIIGIKHDDSNKNVNIIDDNDVVESSDGLFHAPDGRIGKYIIDNQQ